VLGAGLQPSALAVVVNPVELAALVVEWVLLQVLPSELVPWLPVAKTHQARDAALFPVGRKVLAIRAGRPAQEAIHPIDLIVAEPFYYLLF